MEKVREKLSEEAIAIAFEYSSDAKKMLTSFYQALSFEGKETEERRFLLYPYSGSVYTNSSLIKPNDIELASYLDNLGEPQRQTDRENLHNQFKEIYEKVKAVKAKKKKIYFLVSSKYESFDYSPFEYMSSHISGISLHCICIESMKELLEPFVRSNLLNSTLTATKSRSLLDSTYSQEKVTEVICEMLSNISEITVSEKAKAVVHEKMDKDDLFDWYCDDDEDDDNCRDLFWHKSRSDSVKIADRISDRLVQKYPEHRLLIKELGSALYNALSKEEMRGVRGVFTIVDQSNNIDGLLTELQKILEEAYSLPSDVIDTSIYTGETEGVVSVCGSPPEYKSSSANGGRWIQLLSKTSNGEGLIIVKNANHAASDFQGVLSALIDQATIENKYTKKYLDACNIFVITTVSTEGLDVPDEKTGVLLKMAEAENSKLTKGLAQRLSGGNVAMTTAMNPVSAYFAVEDTIKKAIVAYEKSEMTRISCDTRDIAKLYMLSSMQYQTAKRQAGELLQETISKHISPLIKDEHMRLCEVESIEFKVDTDGEASAFFEDVAVSGFAYSEKSIQLNIKNLQTFHDVPTRKSLLNERFDYCLLFPEHYHDRKCNALIQAINALPNSIPIFVIANDDLTRDAYMQKVGVTSSVVTSGSIQTYEWLQEQIEAVAFQKNFLDLKHSAQHITYETECTLTEKVATVRFCTLHLDELWDKKDEEYIRLHESQSSVSFEDIIGLNEQKKLISAMADDSEAARIVLLSGPPGTGKTLLASALARKISQNERCKFLSFASTDFLRGIVGESEAAIKKAFELPRCYPEVTFVVFIDEIEAICMERGSASSFADHSRGVLTVLLNEINGFKGTPKNLILIGATNHKQSIDPALLRRFNRILTIPIPKDASTRNQLVLHYLEKNSMFCSKETIDLFVTRITNLSPSAIITILDTAKYNAKQNGRTIDFELLPALEEHLYGEKNTMLSQSSKEKTAVHEVGHVLMAKHYGKSVNFVSIVAREKFSGYAFIPTDESKSDMSKEDLLQEISILVAGRAAEVAVYGESGVTTGASSDFSRASELALSFVRDFAMGQSLLTLSQELLPDSIKLKQIEEADVILGKCYNTALQLMKSQMPVVNALSKCLLTNYTLMESEINEVLANIHHVEKTM